jgi:glutathione synthase/RimK-type ligase-like ATP-grasp enzyme
VHDSANLPDERGNILKFNLVLIKHCDIAWNDLKAIKEHVRKLDPGIRVVLHKDRRKLHNMIRFSLRPTLAVSFVPVKRFRLFRGTILNGQMLRKSEEYLSLEKAGLPVPRWGLVVPDAQPDLSGFSEHVVVKPDGGAKGAEVKIMRRGRVRYRPWSTSFGAQSEALIAQEFIYPGVRPVSYRVETLFGRALWCLKLERSVDTPELPAPSPDGMIRGWSGQTITSGSMGSTRYSVSRDPEIIALGERAHAAFPDIPLLGVDIVRDLRDGSLWVLEVNAMGWHWYHSSRVSGPMLKEFDIDLDKEFDIFRKAAQVLVRETRARAL